LALAAPEALVTAAVHVSWPQFAGLLAMLAASVGVVVWLCVRWLRERRHERLTRNVIEIRPRRKP